MPFLKKSYWGDSFLGRSIWIENIVITLAYWGISHLNWVVFKKVGVLPMPIWPAAGLALVFAIISGPAIAPALILGTVFANHFSLGASWEYAFCISIMNCLGPITAGLIIDFLAKDKTWLTLNRKHVTLVFLVGVVLAPCMTAIGGIGSKWLLGLIPFSSVPVALLRWWFAHALGTLLFAPPLFILLIKKKADA